MKDGCAMSQRAFRRSRPNSSRKRQRWSAGIEDRDLFDVGFEAGKLGLAGESR
jgi:hypothetical protein